MLRKIRSARWPRELANASMNLNFCVKWLRQIASGGYINDRVVDFTVRGARVNAPNPQRHTPKASVCTSTYSCRNFNARFVPLVAHRYDQPRETGRHRNRHAGGNR